MMKNKFNRALGLSIIAAGMTAAVANAADVTGNASVVVLSTIDASETAAMTFGTIAAFQDDATNTNLARLTLSADPGVAPVVSYPAGTSANSNIVVIADGTPGSFAVTGAAPSTTLSVTLSGATTLTDPSGATTNEFDFVPAGVYYTLNGPGNTFSSQTDATGALEFNVGGTLTTNDTGMTSAAVLEAYADATYTGTYTVTIEY